MRPGTNQGSTTLYFLLFTLVMLGLMVMAVDFGRFYAIQAELQTAADAAALAAATRLAGTMSSADQADLEWNASFDSTTGNDNRFNLRLNQVLFSANLLAETAASYFSSLADAIGNTGGQTGGIDWGSLAYPKFARVQISAQAPVLFASFLNRSPGSLPTIAVSAIAGLSAPLCVATGIDGLAIVDPSMGADSDHFGLVPGDYYTLSLSSSQAALDSTDSTIAYVILDHFPNGVQDTSLLDDLLFELGATSVSTSAGLDPAGTMTIGNIEVAYGSPNNVATTVLQGTTNTAGRDVLCGLNLRFGIDPSVNDACNTGNSIRQRRVAGFRHGLLPGWRMQLSPHINNPSRGRGGHADRSELPPIPSRTVINGCSGCGSNRGQRIVSRAIHWRPGAGAIWNARRFLRRVYRSRKGGAALNIGHNAVRPSSNLPSRFRC
ncbi:MAG: hypothetical protein DMG17_25380 [Acidobacteria bacterium]|nr:MAG: hypothetical protein DMG17_25380 [Acidobacteriota bacterium]